MCRVFRKAFQNAIKDAESLCKKDFIVTFGIRPERPETGYGYLKSGNPLNEGYQLEHFVEKPDEKKAREYLESGDYTWNSGIFMSTSKVLLDAFRQHAPEMSKVFEDFRLSGADLLNPVTVKALYQKVQDQSIDYAIMEHVQNAAVLPVSMQWSDLGSWESLYDISKKDAF